jgi:hypothetical protein
MKAQELTSLGVSTSSEGMKIIVLRQVAIFRRAKVFLLLQFIFLAEKGKKTERFVAQSSPRKRQ